LGSHYGTLGGKIAHFSAENKPKPSKAPELKNMITNPPKKGTGYGYCDVTLEKYHPHANEPYNRSRQLINEANAAHHRKVKGKAFKLNNHPGAFSFISTSCLTPVEAISCKIMKTEIS